MGHEPLIPDPASVTPEMLDADSPFMQARHAWADEQLLSIDAANRGLDMTGLSLFHRGRRPT